MLKRCTKITGLLLAAASVVSSVPSYANEVKYIEAKEGTVNSALAYYTDAGTFYINAELNGEDEAVYCVKGNEYTKLSNIEPGDDITDFVDGKYLEMNYGDWTLNKSTGTWGENDGGYYVDITTGEKEYGIVEMNNHDKALTLKKKIKKDNNGRFDESAYKDMIIEPGMKFEGCTWNEYAYDLEEHKIFGSYIKEKSSVYADKDGNYFDGDYNLGKIGVVTTGCAVTINDKEVTLEDNRITIKNTEDTYIIKDTDENKYEIKALVVDPADLNKGQDYLSRTVNLSIWIKEKDADDSSYINITDKVEFGSLENHHAAPTMDCNSYGQPTGYGMYTKVTQKMSMETASDTIDGIKYPKESKIYFMTDEDGNDETSNKFMYYNDEFSWEPDFSSGKLKARAVNCKSHKGYNYIEFSDVDDAEVEINDWYDMWNTVTIGAAGLCCISDGYIKKYMPVQEKFIDLYKIDRDMNKIKVCWEYTIIVWNEENGYYTIIDEPVPWMMQSESQSTTGAAATSNATDEEKNTNIVSSGWVKMNDGTWSYIKDDGNNATGWLQEGGNWYYLNENGVMQTGWIKYKEIWYYLKESGAMKTGWINDRGSWYYCNTSGAMVTDTVIDGYKLGSDGAWINN